MENGSEEVDCLDLKPVLEKSVLVAEENDEDVSFDFDAKGVKAIKEGNDVSALRMSSIQIQRATTIRILICRKEAGCIIGKNGGIIRTIRESSGAHINISDSKCPERIVSVVGSLDQVYSAFSLICQRLTQVTLTDSEFDLNVELAKSPGSGCALKTPATLSLTLIVSTCQCGSLIGRSGVNIKRIRELTGVSIQVGSQLLTGSTDRMVVLSGSSRHVLHCIYEISCIFMKFPPKTTSIPYLPTNGRKIPPTASSVSVPVKQSPNSMKGLTLFENKDEEIDQSPAEMILTSTVLSSVDSRQPCPMPMTNLELILSNEFIGSVIGWKGSKINEIRHLSGATIRISQPETGNSIRTIRITGSAENVSTAYRLMRLCLQMPVDSGNNNISINSSSSSSNLMVVNSSFLQPILTFPYLTAAQGAYPAVHLTSQTHLKTGLTYGHVVTPMPLYSSKGEQFFFNTKCRASIDSSNNSLATVLERDHVETSIMAPAELLPSSVRPNRKFGLRFAPY